MSSSSPSPPWPPTPVQIREANAHLAALHGRVAELERRLAAAEETVRGQAQSLIRKDDDARRALSDLRRRKDSEIGALEERLRCAEGESRRLRGLLEEKELLVGRLGHRSRLLSEICRSRPALDTLLAHLAEGERLSPGVPDPLPPAPNCAPEHDHDHDLAGADTGTDFSLGTADEGGDEDRDSDQTLFGTTV